MLSNKTNGALVHKKLHKKYNFSKGRKCFNYVVCHLLKRNKGSCTSYKILEVAYLTF